MSIREWFREVAPQKKHSSVAPQTYQPAAAVLPHQYYQSPPMASAEIQQGNTGIPVGQTDALTVSGATRFYHPTSTGSTVPSATAKSLPSGISAARGPRVRFHDPLSLIYATGFRDRRFSLTYDTLRRTSYQLSLLNAIILTRINQVASFSKPYRKNRQLGFEIRFKNERYVPDETQRVALERMEQFISDCGWGPNPYCPFPRDDFETFLKKFVRDSLSLDQGAFEIIPDDSGRPYEFGLSPESLKEKNFQRSGAKSTVKNSSLMVKLSLQSKCFMVALRIFLPIMIWLFVSGIPVQIYGLMVMVSVCILIQK